MKQVEYRENIPPAQNVNVKCESDLQLRPHLISTKARIHFFVFFLLSLVFWTAILDFCGGFRWQLVPRLPFPVPRSPLPVPCFSNIQEFAAYFEDDNLLSLQVSRSHSPTMETELFRVISPLHTTGNPGSVIVPQYGSSKITVFVWGKNIILKFLGNTK